MSKIFHCPVVVFGAGPSGSATAIRLAQLGVDCALVDRAAFPRDKICGDGIPSKILRLLEELNIETDEVLKAGNEIKQMIIYGPAGQILKTRTMKKSIKSSLCCPRYDFDNILFQKAAKSSKWLFCPSKLLNLKRNEKGFELTLKHQSETVVLKTPLIIAADGAHSIMAHRLGLMDQKKDKLIIGLRQYFSAPNFSPKVRIIYDESILPGYVWIFPVAKNRANVGLMYYGFQQSINDLFKKLIQQNPHLNRLLKEARPLDKIRHSILPPGTIPGRRITEGAMLIGDAAAFINPLTGGGICNGVLSGLKAAEIAARAIEKNDFSVKQLMAYETWWQEQLLPAFKLADKTVNWLARINRANLIFSVAEKNLLLRNLFFMSYGQLLPDSIRKGLSFLLRF